MCSKRTVSASCIRTRAIRCAVGLVTNQTALDAHGQRTADVLAHAPGIRLAAIFSPEHGIAGNLDYHRNRQLARCRHGRAHLQRLRRHRCEAPPHTEELAGVDEIVYDIQDVGVRFYTYESTLGYFLEALPKRRTKRLSCSTAPIPSAAHMCRARRRCGRESFVSYWQTPVRHGMTVGELARMFNGERAIGAKLTVVPMQGWMRGDWFDSTGECGSIHRRTCAA